MSRPKAIEMELQDVGTPDARADLAKFIQDVGMAKIEKESWVETTPEVIKKFLPKGLKEDEYFLYEGIFVCHKGMSEKLSQKLTLDLSGSGLNQGVNEGVHG